MFVALGGLPNGLYRVSKALLLGLFDVHGNCTVEGIMFEDYLAVMVAYLQASDRDKFSSTFGGSSPLIPHAN
jgi:hypothetical protein